jgi:hypothetical protein
MTHPLPFLRVVQRVTVPGGLRGGWLLLTLVGVTAPACGAPRTQPPLTAASEETPDGGLPATPPSKKKGVIMPSDTGLGAGPSGATSYTGTNGNAVGPTLGQSPSN